MKHFISFTVIATTSATNIVTLFVAVDSITYASFFYSPFNCYQLCCLNITFSLQHYHSMLACILWHWLPLLHLCPLKLHCDCHLFILFPFYVVIIFVFTVTIAINAALNIASTAATTAIFSINVVPSINNSTLMANIKKIYACICMGRKSIVADHESWLLTIIYKLSMKKNMLCWNWLITLCYVEGKLVVSSMMWLSYQVILL